MKGQYFAVSVVLMVCISFLIFSHASEYSDLETLGFRNCPLKNSCSRVGNADFTERVCECDNLCANYHDCCIDAPVSSSRRLSRHICLHFGNFTQQGEYVINSCPSTYSDGNDVRRKCTSDDFSDPLLSAPVTDTMNRKTYLNRYCALCNDASPTSLTTWSISACKVPMSESNNITWQDVVYQSDVNKWGYHRNGQFHACELKFDSPSSVAGIARPCRTKVVSSCPSTWVRQTYRRACESYMSVVTDSANIAYKNPHCALCNGATPGELMCLSMSIIEKKKVPFSFALLMDVNRKDGDLVGISRASTQSCGRGEKYDPFFKKCRKLVCAIPGYVMANGKCVKS
ncbi:SMB domain-containing protein [Trichonephila clavata]|uniref:SMB domain-containing protein n=1 Tax=Trichonephila clavata TaxID=2740835 RepID=A0A8X6GPV4_TRICU|nr:SMB domain-containing protein [Trichonephila clavata]